MIHFEDQGFLALASYQAKLTMAEGIVLGAGSVLAFAAAHAASKSLAELTGIPVKKIKDLAQKLSKNQEFMKALKENDAELKLVPFSNWTQNDFVDRLEGAARFALETGASVEDLQKIVQFGGGAFLRLKSDIPLMLKPEKDILLRLLKQPEYTARKALRVLKRLGRYANLPEENDWPKRKQHDVANYENAWNLVDRISRMSPEAAKVFESKADWESVDDYGIGIITDDIPEAEMMGVVQENFDLSQQEILRPFIKKIASAKFDPNFPDFLPLLKRIAENRTREDLERINTKYFTINDLSSLASLGKMPIPPEDFVEMEYTLKGTKDWANYEKDIKDFQLIPDFYKQIVDPPYVLKLWRLAQKNEEVKKAIFTAKAAMEAVGPNTKMMRFSTGEMLKYLAGVDPNFVGDIGPNMASKTWWVDGLSNLIKSGALKKYDQAAKSHGWQANVWDYHDTLGAYLQSADKIGEWSTIGELKEKMAVLEGQKHTSFKKPGSGFVEQTSLERLERNRALEKSNKTRRARDRLAQRDPEWAISEYPEEYQRGRRIARFLDELVGSVEDLVKKGNTVVVHGRDGELLYDLLMRRPGIDKSKIRYAITSRPITTWAATEPLTEHHRQELQRYYDYLGRMVPTGAVHIDTGFAGSIPRWLDQQGFEVKSIAMVSANRPEEQLPVSMAITDQERRDIVLSDLEHSSQRLDVLKKYDPATGVGGFGGMTYSLAAPGYHARAYGVYDELGLPRLRAKTPATRFEERQRFRVASQESDVEPEAVMEEETLLKVK